MRLISLLSIIFGLSSLSNASERVLTWGDCSYGGDSNSVSADLSSGVTSIYSTIMAFAALKEDGSVATWGYGTADGELLDISSSDIGQFNYYGYILETPAN